MWIEFDMVTHDSVYNGQATQDKSTKSFQANSSPTSFTIPYLNDCYKITFYDKVMTGHNTIFTS